MPNKKPLEMSEPAARPRVMLVEDDLMLAELYRLRMDKEGFEVQACRDGEQALQMAKAFKPQLILLDIMMPKLNGFDVLDILRNTPETKNVKIVVLSAMGQASDIEKAKSLGADDYLVKSQVLITDVMALLRHHLGLSPRPDSAESA